MTAIHQTPCPDEGPCFACIGIAVYAMLDGYEWSPDTLAMIADVLGNHGLTVHEPARSEPCIACGEYKPEGTECKDSECSASPYWEV